MISLSNRFKLCWRLVFELGTVRRGQFLRSPPYLPRMHYGAVGASDLGVPIEMLQCRSKGLVFCLKSAS
jgi:hypothetical protein